MEAETEKTPLSLSFIRTFSDPKTDPYEAIEWEQRTAQIVDAKGNVIFEQQNVEVPKAWSQTATNIVASKYLHGKVGTPERESGVRALIMRVVNTITDAGAKQDYFRSVEDMEVFRDELATLMLTQRASFNSPVWFNVGCDALEPNAEAENWHWIAATKKVLKEAVGYKRPQCSACFINSVDDSMEGIMKLATTEALLFKFGSGTGTNFSSLRSSAEHVSGGGVASGPLSFMKGLDAFAGVIKSGGKTRRAAKMAILNVSHPDIVGFITCKQKEEAKAYALMREGYDGSSGPDSEAYASIFYQNANNSVRVSDEFMKAVEADEDWNLIGVKSGAVHGTIKARKLLELIAEATWSCGDPGMQYDTIINKWHTSKNTGRINASNPCSEYMFLDDSACNLASINLLKFLRKNGSFDAVSFRAAVDIMITAQDILVDLSGYPTEQIARNSHDYRPLGLGYANLGALLMALGLPYDSDEGRGWAAAITSIMCGEAYLQSARIAEAMKPLPSATGLKPGSSGACPGYFPNSRSFLEVIHMHRDCSGDIQGAADDLKQTAMACWQNAYDLGLKVGYRNAQVTVLAPTGTIGFMMDCDTTGIEPELALVKYKRLVGGGMIKIVNETVPRALHRLGYRDGLLEQIIQYIDQHGTVEGSAVAKHHLAVFDTSFKPSEGTRSIHYMGHLKMMACTQPFLSGAISKTINMPEEATVEEIAHAYIEGWKLGLKAIAIYRDGSKRNQVLVTKKEETHPLEPLPEQEDMSGPPKAVRHRLPDDRQSITHKFSIASHDGYLHVGLYPNGQPGEIFITMAKEGSTISGLMDSLALSISVALQHGVPLKTIVEKLAHTRFEPSGWTKNKNIGFAKSITDYIARFLENRFLIGQQQTLFNAESPVLQVTPTDENFALKEMPTQASQGISAVMDMGDSPACATCGAIMVRNGSCYRCMECGGTSGCS